MSSASAILSINGANSYLIGLALLVASSVASGSDFGASPSCPADHVLKGWRYAGKNDLSNEVVAQWSPYQVISPLELPDPQEVQALWNQTYPDGASLGNGTSCGQSSIVGAAAGHQNAGGFGIAARYQPNCASTTSSYYNTVFFAPVCAPLPKPQPNASGGTYCATGQAVLGWRFSGQNSFGSEPLKWQQYTASNPLPVATPGDIQAVFDQTYPYNYGGGSLCGTSDIYVYNSNPGSYRVAVAATRRSPSYSPSCLQSNPNFAALFFTVVCGPCAGYTLSLNGPSQAEPGAVLTGFTIKAADKCTGKPVSGLSLTVSSHAMTRSGYHEHGGADASGYDPDRPRGGIRAPCAGTKCSAKDQPGSSDVTITTDANGEYKFDFVAPPPAGIHDIKVKCADASKACNAPTPHNVEVKVEGLQLISDGHFRYIGDTARHGLNHYLKPFALQNLRDAARVYFKRFGQPLYVNDASLPWGGLFDLNGQWNTGAGHSEHRCGRAVDIRANNDSKEGSIPIANEQAFINIARNFGIEVLLHQQLQNTDDAHYHLWLIGEVRKENPSLTQGKITCSQLP